MIYSGIMTTHSPILEAVDVSFEYPNKRALHQVSFSLYPGSVTALVGPNGSGKTTLLRCLAALDQPFSGAIRVSGYDTVVDPRQCHESLGYLSDSFGLYDELSVHQCLLHQGAIHNLSGKALSGEIDRVVGELDLEPLLQQRAGSLSRGQRQRTGVALSLLHQPKVLLLDEPASGLDPEARGNLSGLFRGLREKGLCILVSSHILAELEDYSDRMLTLREGKILGDEVVRHESRAESVNIRIELLQGNSAAENMLRARPEISTLEVQSNSLSFRFSGPPQQQADLLRELINQGTQVLEFAVERVSLEAVYRRQIEEQKKV